MYSIYRCSNSSVFNLIGHSDIIWIILTGGTLNYHKMQGFSCYGLTEKKIKMKEESLADVFLWKAPEAGRWIYPWCDKLPS